MLQDQAFNLSAPYRCTGVRRPFRNRFFQINIINNIKNNNYPQQQNNNYLFEFSTKRTESFVSVTQIIYATNEGQRKKIHYHLLQSSRLVSSSSSSHCRTTNFRNSHSEANFYSWFANRRFKKNMHTPPK